MTNRAVWAVVALAGLVACGSNDSPTQPVAAQPTPTPAPTPTPTPQVQSCNLPASTGSSSCSTETPQFAAELVRAQDKVRAEQPHLFTSSGLVLSEDDYVRAVVTELRALGLCASQGPPRDEVAIKVTNDWNDQYDIVLGSGEVWSNYAVTCRPARF